MYENVLIDLMAILCINCCVLWSFSKKYLVYLVPLTRLIYRHWLRRQSQFILLELLKNPNTFQIYIRKYNVCFQMASFGVTNIVKYNVSQVQLVWPKFLFHGIYLFRTSKISHSFLVLQWMDRLNLNKSDVGNSLLKQFLLLGSGVFENCWKIWLN